MHIETSTINEDISQKITKKYQKKTLREQILLRPGMYIGDINQEQIETYVHDGEKHKFLLKPLTYVPALYKVIDEVISNSCDQHIRLKQLASANPKRKINHVKNIHISIDIENKSFTVFNDGEGIEIQIHREHNIYVPELIFGNLLTGSNYDDSEERLTIGMNGMGVKLCNIFAHRFEIETVDAYTQKRYYQTFEQNMNIINTPHITTSNDKPYTRITVFPDFEYFGLNNWTPDIIKILERRAFDVATFCGNSVVVLFNNKVIESPNFEQFMDLFEESEFGKVYEMPHPNWEVGVCMSETGFKQYSFINGTFTFKGGKHVEYITNQIIKTVTEIIEKKKKIKVTSDTIRTGLFVFVKASIVNPNFDSQSKETLTTSSKNFGSKFTLSPQFYEKLTKIGFIDRTIERYEFKESNKIKKENQKKRGGRIYDIEKLIDAFEADGPNRKMCTLILTEGDSAKSLAVAGLSVVGREYFGVFPLRGKLINAREKNTTAKGREQLNKNVELDKLIKILGLEIGKEYSSLDDLRYGHVMIMTDQDVDGSHIKGLFMNWVATFWPSLLSLGFINSLLTPILKAKKNKNTCLSFYSINEYNEWKNSQESLKGWNIKYYKGLGTSTSEEAKQYFKEFKKVDYFVSEDNASFEAIDLAFNGKRTHDRKKWLDGFDKNYVMDPSLSSLSYEDFINHVLIDFSHYDNHRSIPSIMDGFKPSQRKILYTMFERNYTKELKVSQLSGAVSETSSYHHGEESLNKAIVAMAQDFVCSNNINLLMPNGQFGTRLFGGEDASSPRYTFTILNKLTKLLFKKEDNDILTYLNDDGKTIEPEFYIPILPMILINGSNGIGTGYSCNVPCFNPTDVANQFLNKLNGIDFTEINPYYRDFKGEIVKLSDQSFLTKGKYKIKTYKTIEITELPIGTWTEDYKDFLYGLTEEGQKMKQKDVKDKFPFEKSFSSQTPQITLKSVREGYTETDIGFEIEFKLDTLKQLIKETRNSESGVDYIEKSLKLTSKLCLSNMHLFDEKGHIKKYNSAIEIMEEFYRTRFEYYAKRKQHIIDVIEKDINILRQKARFANMVVRKELIISDFTVSELIERMRSLEFIEMIFQKDKESSYNYLIDEPLRNLTIDRYSQLCDKLAKAENELAFIKEQSVEQLWKKDINEFLDVYLKRKTSKEILGTNEDGEDDSDEEKEVYEKLVPKSRHVVKKKMVKKDTKL